MILVLAALNSNLMFVDQLLSFLIIQFFLSFLFFSAEDKNWDTCLFHYLNDRILYSGCILLILVLIINFRMFLKGVCCRYDRPKAWCNGVRTRRLHGRNIGGTSEEESKPHVLRLTTF